MRDAATDYQNPDALTAMSKFLTGQQQVKNLPSPQTQRLLDFYGKGANALVPSLIDKTVGPAGYAYMASATADTFHQLVSQGQMTPEQAQAQYAAYLRQQDAAHPGFIAATQQFGVDPRAALDQRVATRPNLMPYGAQNPMLREADFTNGAPPDASGAGNGGQQMGGPPALPDGTVPPPPDAAAPQGGMPPAAAAPQGRPAPQAPKATGLPKDPDSQALFGQLTRIAGLSAGSRAAIRNYMMQGHSAAEIYQQYPQLKSLAGTARGASAGRR